MNYTCDFETTTDKNDCRVWCFGLCNIDVPSDFIYGYTLDELMEWCIKNNPNKLYFHNLKFDGEFIIDWLFRNGYKHITKKEDRKALTFETLISDKGLFYSLKIWFQYEQVKGKKYIAKRSVTILDSIKVIPLSVKEIGKTYGIKEQKLDIDYHKPRPIGYKMDAFELMYLKNDCTIVAKALKMVFDLGHKKMTQGSNALEDYKSRLNKFEFEKYFPTPSYAIDKQIRDSYKGGWTYCNKKFKEKEIGEGLVLDVNSLYPYVMRHKLLPYGMPVYFKGEYKNDKLYDLYVQSISCQFELKEGYLPTIQIKKSIFNETEYLESSWNKKLEILDEVTLTLTHIDLKLFLEHYNVYNLEYIDGWKFKGKTGMFDEYIDEWTSLKIKSNPKVKDNPDANPGMYMYAKLMQNALYGKFALNPNVRSKLPYFDNEEDRVKYRYGEKEIRDALYIPLGTYVTSWARYITISTAQKLYDRFIYADTDSLHLTGWDLPEGINIHHSNLGAWKMEYKFKNAKYLRAKCYIDILADGYAEFAKDEEGNYIYNEDGTHKMNDMHITIAGMPASCYKYVTFENFKFGSRYNGKLTMKHVKGGIVLIDTTYEIKR